MTVQIPSQNAPAVTKKSPRVYEAEVDELLSMFNTDQISQEEIDRECELVRAEFKRKFL